MYSLRIPGGGRGREPLNIIVRLISNARETLGSRVSMPAVRNAESSAGGIISNRLNDCSAGACSLGFGFASLFFLL